MSGLVNGDGLTVRSEKSMPRCKSSLWIGVESHAVVSQRRARLHLWSAGEGGREDGARCEAKDEMRNLLRGTPRSKVEK